MKKFVFALLLLIGSQLQAQTGKDEALEALGGSGGLLLYDTYLVIGEAADAFTKDTYTAEEVEKIVQEQIGGIETVQGQYDALLATKFLSDPADSKFLRELTDAFDLVVAEGKALDRLRTFGKRHRRRALRRQPQRRMGRDFKVAGLRRRMNA
jgi:hypothetical protein